MNSTPREPLYTDETSELEGRSMPTGADVPGRRMRARWRSRLVARLSCVLASVAVGWHPAGLAAPIALDYLNLSLYTPVGVGFIPADAFGPDSLVVAINWVTGDPNNFVLVKATPTVEPYMDAAYGWAAGEDEFEQMVGTVRQAMDGFQQGDAFAGTGTPGEVGRLVRGGAAIKQWCTLPGETGWPVGVCVDANKVYQNKCHLIVVTTSGNVYAVNANAQAILLGTLVVQEQWGYILHGVTTVPKNLNPNPYGSLAGKIVAVSRHGRKVVVVDPSVTPPTVVPYPVKEDGVEIDAGYFDDVAVIPDVSANQWLYVVEHQDDADAPDHGDLWKAGPDQFAGMLGKLLLVVETSPAKLYQIAWNQGGGRFDAVDLTPTDGPTHYEQATFCPVTVARATPIVTLSVTDPLATEGAFPNPEDPGILVFERTGNLAGAAEVTFSVEEDDACTAVRGEDYRLFLSSGEPVPENTVTFPSSVNKVEVWVVALTDGFADNGECVTVTVLDGASYDPGEPHEGSVYIADATGPNLVMVFASDPMATEPGPEGDVGEFTLLRAGNVADALTVNYRLSGIAQYGETLDYTLDPSPSEPPPYHATFEAGATNGTIMLNPNADTFQESTEPAILQLQAGGYTIVPDYASATVEILERPTVTVIASVPQASEAGVSGQFKFMRTGGIESPLTVTVQPGGTATFGQDYQPDPWSDGLIEFDAGHAAVWVAVRPVADSRKEPTETVQMTVLAGTGYTVGTPGSATVSITDNDTVALPRNYTVTAAPSAYPSYGYGINNAGQVCGYYYPPPGALPHAFLWLNGYLMDLNYPNCWSYAYGLNNNWVVAGWGCYPTVNNNFPLKWKNLQITTLGHLVAPGLYDYAMAVNNGEFTVGACQNSAGRYHAVRWNGSDPAAVDLQTLGGDNPLLISYAYGINAAGRVVGKSQTPIVGNPYQAYRTAGGLAVITLGSDELGTMNGGAGQSEATAINDLDEVVGASDSSSGQYRAFYKSALSGPDQGFTDLGVLPNGNRSLALDINNVGHVVGKSRTTPTGSERAFICFNDGSAMRNLNGMLANGTGWVLSEADELNDSGWIVGSGTRNGQPTAFLLTPNY